MTVTTEPQTSATWTIKPTALERSLGRLMRGPDDHGDEGAGEVNDQDSSLLGDAKDGEGEADKEADKPADEGDKSGEVDKGEEGDADKPEEVDDKTEDGLPKEYKLDPPEGFDEIDGSLLDAAAPIFHELGLGNEQAQKLVPLVPLIQSAVAEAQNAEFQAASTAWAKEAKADPHMGGAHWKETETFVAKALDLAATKLPTIEREVDGQKVQVSGKEQVEEFRELLNATKLGNHPTMLRVFRFFGQGISEDSDFIRADGGAQIKKSREEILYPEDARKS
jgi:hypothetical protein